MEEMENCRCRLFYLKPSEDPARQAEAACEVLAGTQGVILAAPASRDSIHLIYSLNHLSFELLAELLAELGFELEDSILLSLRNTIYQFLEDNARDNMHVDEADFHVPCDSPPSIPHLGAEKYWDDYH